MADDARGKANSGGSSKPKKKLHLSGIEHMNTYVFVQTCILMGVTGLGYLALGWSSVTLLGGLVTSLRKTDFWCITFITFVQVARVFDGLAEQLAPHEIILKIFWYMHLYFKRSKTELPLTQSHRRTERRWSWKKIVLALIIGPIYVFVALPIALLLGFVVATPVAFYIYGPWACLGLSVWRIHKRDYGAGNYGYTPALDGFYSLVLCQGILYIIWFCTDVGEKLLAVEWRQRCGFPEGWGDMAILEYLSATRTRCRWAPTSSLAGWDVIHYAASLLESQSWQDNLRGLRMLDAIIQVMDSDHWKGPKEVVRSVLLPSRATIKKLLRGPETNREHRVLAARIVAHLAGDIRLSQFPGAMQYICSLLQEDTTRTDFHSLQQAQKPSFIEILLQKIPFHLALQRAEEQPQEGDQQQQQADGTSHHYIGAGGCNEVILQGLRILERLASDNQNCRDICATPGLLTKISAPVCSATLIEHITISDWAQVVNGSMKVLHQLIRAPGEASTTLRRDISNNEQAMSNLKWILETRASHGGSKEASPQEALDSSRGDEEGSSPPSTHAGPELSDISYGYLCETRREQQASNEQPGGDSGQGNDGAGPELQIQAMEVMTQLALDASINLDEEIKENLIKKQLHIFLADDQGGEGAVARLKLTAGAGLAVLSTSSEINSAFIVHRFDDIVGLLAETPDAKNNITYRKLAAQILGNLCTHSPQVLNKHAVKETLLPKVLTELREIPSTKREVQEGENSDQGKTRSTIKRKKHDENQRNSAGRNDENYQEKNSIRGNNADIQAISNELTATKEVQEALLSLILAIYVMLGNPNDFNDSDEKKALGNGQFVEKLKDIIEDNCQATADSLRIVKLCGQIAETMMQRNQYTEHFRIKEFAKSLSKASKIMSSLESCMIFAGTDFELKKTVRPLLSDLEKKVRQQVE